MKAAQPLIGIILVVVGLIWIGQGVGLIGGSFMTGVPFWAAAGVVCLVAGAVLIYRAVRRPKSQP
jgi:glucose dehydrogenase